MADKKEPPTVVTLSGVSDGAAAELWQAALGRVLENVEDPNTDHKAKRSITLSFVFSADEERKVGGIDIKCAVKLAGMKGVTTVVFYGRHEGELIAVEQPRQQDLFPAPGGKMTRLVPGGKAGV